MRGIGSLIVDMQLRMAEFTKSTNEAKGQIKSIGEAATKAGDLLKQALGVGVGVASVRQLAQLSDEYTKYTAQLKLATSGQASFLQAQDDVRSISDRAQASLSGIGTLYARISTAARELGFEQRTTAEITEAVALALKVSGASVQESASAILQLSQAFASGRLAGEEFRAISEASPRIMRALAEGLNVPIGSLKQMAADGKLTSEVLARELPKALASLRGEAESITTIGGAVQQLKNRFIELVGVNDEVSGSSKAVADYIKLIADNIGLLKVPIQTLIVLGGNFAYVFRTIGISIAGVKEQLDGFTRGGIKGFRESRRLVGQILDEERKKFDEWEKSVMAGGKAVSLFAADAEDAAQGSAIAGRRTANLTTDDGKSKADRAFQDATARAEQQIKALERITRVANEQANSDIELLQSRLNSGLLAYSDFYNTKGELQRQALAVQAANTAQEIKLLESTRSKAKTEADRAGLDAKVAEANERLADAPRKVQADAVRGFLAMQDAAEAYRRKVDDIGVSLLELAGKTREAALARNALAQEDLRREATQRRDTGTLAKLDEQARLLANQAEINALLQQSSIIQEQLANSEERARLSFETGAAGELTTLQRVSEARKAAADQLAGIADTYRLLAADSGNPQLVQQAENFRVQLERLAASADLVKDKFKAIGESAFADFLSDIVSGTKKVSDAFKDMANSIVQQVTRLAAQDIAKKIFGSSTSSGGGSSGGGGSSIIGSIFETIVKSLTGRAEGGPVRAGSTYLVGEAGPEIFTANRNGTIIPNGAGMGGGNSVNITINMPPGASRETAMQAAARAGQAVQIALRRNG